MLFFFLFFFFQHFPIPARVMFSCPTTCYPTFKHTANRTFYRKCGISMNNNRDNEYYGAKWYCLASSLWVTIFSSQSFLLAVQFCQSLHPKKCYCGSRLPIQAKDKIAILYNIFIEAFTFQSKCIRIFLCYQMIYSLIAILPIV